MKAWMYAAALLALSSIPAVGMAGADGQTKAAKPAAAGLIGYWPLHGDCRDHSGNDYFSGKIREVRLYGRALLPNEIAGLAADNP